MHRTSSHESPGATQVVRRTNARPEEREKRQFRQAYLAAADRTREKWKAELRREVEMIEEMEDDARRFGRK